MVGPWLLLGVVVGLTDAGLMLGELVGYRQLGDFPFSLVRRLNPL